MGFPLYGLLDEATRSKMNHLRVDLKKSERTRWEAQRDSVLAEKKASKLARRVERARLEGWTITQVPKAKPHAQTVRGVFFTKQDLAILAAEIVAPREATA